MTTPSAPLSPQEENALLEEIVSVVRHEAPTAWRELYLQYCAVGAHVETISTIKDTAGNARHWSLPPSIPELLDRLRAGMYRPELGTWTTFASLITHPGTYSVSYDREREPDWLEYPAQADFHAELARHPRPADAVPDWLRRGASVEQPELPTVTKARLFDGMGPDRKPVVTRPPVPAEEVPAVLEYLRTAPVIQVVETGGFRDLLAADRKVIPRTVARTDGAWVWLSSVPYYLEKYGVAPDPGLLAHIRANRFRVPNAVPETGLRVAYAVITEERIRRHRLPTSPEIRAYLADVATRAAATAPESQSEHGTGPRGFSRARVFDGQTDDGAPVVDREPLTAEEKDRVLTYLVAGELVLSGRGRVADQLDPEHPRRVPVAWLTDGTWLWQPAVRYYLEKHGVAPDASFLAHIRANEYRMPAVAPETVRAAARAVTPAAAPETPAPDRVDGGGTVPG
ncbi:hypothetical protein FHR81_002879 [Actinoalloteichus hoggarensis]|uniref:Uncharacterized protein n=1 Tax=Actinoalloteichus hoggarensis TaxID=1470176 RepID=A0A221VZ06_9PSEU|nr:hypothetical protein [Actinoalloteichus hoggarensis]ASO18471.1 hypothetical protein AHOG_04075 [Actinoalloteichus hoggarensis]MBB5921839.1 hypothetical protein [Actinoalloteichus hoggarensis]